MSTPQETRFITSRTIDDMSEHYRGMWFGFSKGRDRVQDADLGDALGTLFAKFLGPAYEKAQLACEEALLDGCNASLGISYNLDTCAANWRAAEQASIVEYR